MTFSCQEFQSNDQSSKSQKTPIRIARFWRQLIDSVYSRQRLRMPESERLK